MPAPTTNNGTTYYNANVCRSFNQIVTTALVALSSQACSEVIISNQSGVGLLIFDNDYSSASNGFLIDDNETFTIRGITNSAQVSAKTVSSSGAVYYRTQYYSGNTMML